jgi:transporter family protein
MVSYLVWAVLALLSYTMVAPLVSLATPDVPSDVALIVANGILVVVALGAVTLSGENPLRYLDHPKAPLLYAAGLFLSVGILSYYRALAAGPVSVVVPVFGLFIVTSSVVGVVALDEPLTLRKGVGIALAVVAIVLTSLD